MLGSHLNSKLLPVLTVVYILLRQVVNSDFRSGTLVNDNNRMETFDRGSRLESVAELGGDAVWRHDALVVSNNGNRDDPLRFPHDDTKLLGIDAPV